METYRQEVEEHRALVRTEVQRRRNQRASLDSKSHERVLAPAKKIYNHFGPAGLAVGYLAMPFGVIPMIAGAYIGKNYKPVLKTAKKTLASTVNTGRGVVDKFHRANQYEELNPEANFYKEDYTRRVAEAISQAEAEMANRFRREGVTLPKADYREAVRNYTEEILKENEPGILGKAERFYANVKRKFQNADKFSKIESIAKELSLRRGKKVTIKEVYEELIRERDDSLRD